MLSYSELGFINHMQQCKFIVSHLTKYHGCNIDIIYVGCKVDTIYVVIR
jgi:hypothetical protein